MASGGAIATRKKTEVWLIGQMQDSLSHRQLPIKKEVMQLFFHYKQNLKQTIRDACRSTTENVMEIWAEARIPTKFQPDVVNKVEKIFKEWKKLKKNKENTTKRSDSLKQKEGDWKLGLEELFDIAHANALEMIEIEEDKQFLMAQREKGRRGKIGTVDLELSRKEANAKLKQECLKRRMEREREEIESRTERVSLASSSEDEAEQHPATQSERSIDDPSTSSLPHPPKRGRKNILNKDLASSLDTAKISNRNAALVLNPAIKHLGQEASDFNANYSSIRRQRMKFRKSIGEGLKNDFKANVPLTIHWDSKLMEDITGKQKVDRLPILISGEGVEQLLGVPKLSSGTGEEAACAVYEAIKEWDICDKVTSMSFDTTSVNTGPWKGACIFIQQKMKKDMLWLACRHHILEIMLEAVILHSFGPSTGPEILLFKRFQNNWPAIDCNYYQTAASDDFVKETVADISDETIAFAADQLQKFQPRDDYKELLELTIIFLGGVPEKGISFKTPAGMHRARWMVKAMYSIKIWMFRGQFKLSKHELKALQKICVFVVRIYVKFWFQAASATSAPRNDLLLLKILDTYKQTEKSISEVALKKILGHLWYLSEELVAFSFFDDEVPCETKRKMVCALKSPGDENPMKRIMLDPALIQEKELEHFVTSSTRRFFSITGLPSNFMDKNVNEWENDDEFRAVKGTIRSMKVVNDTAERGVALMDEYNKLLTNNEEQKQFLLQTVKDYRKRFPDRKKSTLLKM